MKQVAQAQRVFVPKLESFTSSKEALGATFPWWEVRPRPTGESAEWKATPTQGSREKTKVSGPITSHLFRLLKKRKESLKIPVLKEPDCFFLLFTECHLVATASYILITTLTTGLKN